MTHNYVKQFPVLPPSAYDPTAIAFIHPRTLANEPASPTSYTSSTAAAKPT